MRGTIGNPHQGGSQHRVLADDPGQLGLERAEHPRHPAEPRQQRIGGLSDASGRAEIAAEFLRRNHTYRAEHAQMQQRIADGAVAKNAAETAFARRWGLSFRHGAG